MRLRMLTVVRCWVCIMGRDVSKHAIQDAQSIDLKSSWREMEIASTSPMWEPRRMLCTQMIIMLILLLLALMCRPESVLYRFSFECSIFILGFSVLYQKECMRSSRTPTLVMWMLSSEDQWSEDPGWQVWIHLCPWCNPPASPTTLWPNPIPSELSPAPV